MHSMSVHAAEPLIGLPELQILHRTKIGNADGTLVALMDLLFIRLEPKLERMSLLSGRHRIMGSHR